MFSRYGIPDQLMSDNRPQFASTEFTAFAKNGVSSTLHPHPGITNHDQMGRLRIVLKQLSICFPSAKKQDSQNIWLY